MGERIAIQLINTEAKFDIKSQWLYGHWAGIDYHWVRYAIHILRELPFSESPSTPITRREPSALIVQLIGELKPDRVYDSTVDYSKGNGMDWGAWQIDVNTLKAINVETGESLEKVLESLEEEY